MSMEQKVLFGIDDSEFARQAAGAAGDLLKNNVNLKIKVFYGAPDPNISHLAKLLRLSSETVEEYETVCTLEEQSILEGGLKALLWTLCWNWLLPKALKP